VLTKRIIPCLDVKGGRVVKGTHFLNLRDAGDPVELGERYTDDGADELVFLDITASHEGRDTLTELVRAVALKINIPFTVGGGIRNLEDARSILLNGADKTSVNTAAVENPGLISEISGTFGNQCAVVAIDAKRRYEIGENKNIIQTEKGPCWFEIFTYGGRKATGLDAVEWAKKAEFLGSGEILLTSMDRDGTKQGYDLELTRTVSEAVNVPVIASGGAGKPEHFADVFIRGRADAALAASVFHYGNYPVPFVKKFLKDRGVNVRI
jgi:cyclase